MRPLPVMESVKTFPWPTNGGYDVYEVMSALQKSIRRGIEEQALFWATEMFMSQYVDMAWSRLLIIASEDVGIADSNVVVQVKTLHDLYAAHKKAKKEGGEDKLWFIHAVLILVRAPKTRTVDHALITYFEGEREPVEIPDYALDVHTSTGRAMGRGNTHFFEHGAVLEPSAERHFMPMYDPYLERAKTIRCRKRP